MRGSGKEQAEWLARTNLLWGNRDGDDPSLLARRSARLFL